MSKLLVAVLYCWLGLEEAWAVDSESLLSPEEAFQLDAEPMSSGKLLLSWEIADGYYLYRHKIKVVSLTPDLQLGEPVFSAAEIKQDRHYGSVDVYRDQLRVELPIQRQQSETVKLALEVTYQGCADIGVCYLPITKVISPDLPIRAAPARADQPFNDLR